MPQGAGWHTKPGIQMRSIAAAAMLLGTVATADEPAPRVPAELRNCIAIQRNTERLACFDRGINTLLDTGAKPAVSLPSAESSFGLFAQAPVQAKTDTPRARKPKPWRRGSHRSSAADGSAIIVLDNNQKLAPDQRQRHAVAQGRRSDRDPARGAGSFSACDAERAIGRK